MWYVPYYVVLSQFSLIFFLFFFVSLIHMQSTHTHTHGHRCCARFWFWLNYTMHSHIHVVIQFVIHIVIVDFNEKNHLRLSITAHDKKKRVKTTTNKPNDGLDWRNACMWMWDTYTEKLEWNIIVCRSGLVLFDRICEKKVRKLSVKESFPWNEYILFSVFRMVGTVHAYISYRRLYTHTHNTPSNTLYKFNGSMSTEH